MYLIKAVFGLLSPSRRPLSQGAIIIATKGDVVTNGEYIAVDNDHPDRDEGDEIVTGSEDIAVDDDRLDSDDGDQLDRGERDEGYSSKISIVYGNFGDVLRLDLDLLSLLLISVSDTFLPFLSASSLTPGSLIRSPSLASMVRNRFLFLCEFLFSLQPLSTQSDIVGVDTSLTVLKVISPILIACTAYCRTCSSSYVVGSAFNYESH